MAVFGTFLGVPFFLRDGWEKTVDGEKWKEVATN